MDDDYLLDVLPDDVVEALRIIEARFDKHFANSFRERKATMVKRFYREQIRSLIRRLYREPHL
jgi:hypothetical protein